MALPKVELEPAAEVPRRPSAVGLSLFIALCTGLLLALMAIEVAGWQRDARVAAVLVEARAVADAAGKVDTSSEAGEALVQKAVVGLPQALPGLKEAMVLEGTRFVAHSDASLAGTRLKRDDLTHKALYDDSRALQENLSRNGEEREKYQDLKKNPFTTSILRVSDGEIYAGVPIMSGTEMRGMLVLRSSPPSFPVGALAFQLSLLAAGMIGLALLLWKVAPGDARAVVGAVFLAASSGLIFMQVQEATTAYRLQLGEAAARGFAVWNGLEKEALAAPPAVGEAATAGDGVAAGEAAAPPAAGEAAAPPAAGETAGPPAAGEAAAPVAVAPVSPPAAPQSAEFVTASNLDEYGNPAGWFLSAAEAGLTGQGVVSQSGGSVQLAPDVGVSAVWAWRGLGAVLAVGLLYLLLLITGWTKRAADSFFENWYAYAYVAPAVIGTAVLVFGPFLFGIVLGFYTRIYSSYEFVGFRNFIEILSNLNIRSSQNFYRTLGVTVMWTAVNVFLHVSIGLGLAMILKDKALRFTPIYRTLLVVPWALPNYITALIWKGMFNKEYGAINAFLALVGIEPVSWFNSFWGAFTANVVTNVWLGFPFMMVISLGALQSIPTDLYEAADVDGAGRWDKFRRITLPLLKPALFPAVILGTIWTFNQFNVIYLVSGGAPNNETDILITEAYRWAFEGRQQYGYAAAYSTIIFLILFGYTFVTNKITKSTEGAFE